MADIINIRYEYICILRSEGKTILQKLIEVVESRLVLLEDNSIRNGF